MWASDNVKQARACIMKRATSVGQGLTRGDALSSVVDARHVQRIAPQFRRLLRNSPPVPSDIEHEAGVVENARPDYDHSL